MDKQNKQQKYIDKVNRVLSFLDFNQLDCSCNSCDRGYMAQKELSFEEEMEKAAETLYGKYVPAGVREFIEMTAGSKLSARPKKPKPSLSSAVGTAPAPGGDSD